MKGTTIFFSYPIQYPGVILNFPFVLPFLPSNGDPFCQLQFNILIIHSSPVLQSLLEHLPSNKFNGFLTRVPSLSLPTHLHSPEEESTIP